MVTVLKHSLVADRLIDDFIRNKLEHKVLRTTSKLSSIYFKHRSTEGSEHIIIVVLNQQEVRIILIIQASIV